MTGLFRVHHLRRFLNHCVALQVSTAPGDLLFGFHRLEYSGQFRKQFISNAYGMTVPSEALSQIIDDGFLDAMIQLRLYNRKAIVIFSGYQTLETFEDDRTNDSTIDFESKALLGASITRITI